MSIKTYKEAVETLFHREKTLDYSLEKMQKAAAFFGNPQDTYKIIHVTGTNGKGSVCAMVFSVLKNAGKKVGLFTSPHIVEVRERFQTEMGLISEDDFVDILNQVLLCPIKLSYFEKCVMIAFLYFATMNCEYVVLEVGMGGLLDSTNIVNPIITAITTVGIDHTVFLGKTIEEISVQKAGIIKIGIPLVYNHKNPIIEQTARERNAPLLFTEKLISTNLLGKHQQKNGAIAYEICEYILGLEKRAFIIQGLQKVQHPGRLHRLTKNLLLDGAHNKQGLQIFLEYLETLEMKKKYSTIYYCVAQKVGRSGNIILEVFNAVEEFILIDSRNTVMIETPHILQEKVLKQKGGLSLNIQKAKVIMKMAEREKESLFVVFGSLYVLGDFLGKNTKKY